MAGMQGSVGHSAGPGSMPGSHSGGQPGNQPGDQPGYALVTGASYGLGEEYARQLAARGWPLILVARSQDRLELLRTALLGQHPGLDVRCIAMDLTGKDVPAELFRLTVQAGLPVHLLVNNAGFGAFGEFVRIDRARQRQMIDLNVGALVELSHLYLAPMSERRGGAILNVASVAGFVPLPYSAVYAATKAFVVSFSHGLREEARQHGVQILLVNPGPTETNFFQEAGMSPFGGGSRMQTAAQVVRESLRALDRGRGSVTTGAPNRMIVRVTALIPKRWIAAVVGRQARKTLPR